MQEALDIARWHHRPRGVLHTPVQRAVSSRGAAASRFRRVREDEETAPQKPLEEDAVVRPDGARSLLVCTRISCTSPSCMTAHSIVETHRPDRSGGGRPSVLLCHTTGVTTGSMTAPARTPAALRSTRPPGLLPRVPAGPPLVRLNISLRV